MSAIVETIQAPAAYSLTQLHKACYIAERLNRGRLVLLETPELGDR